MHILFSLVLLFSSDAVLVYSQVCNPIECFGHISKIFQDVDGKDSCVKFAKIENCFGLCYPVTHDESIVSGMQEVKQEICKHDQDNKLYNKCVDKHKYLLLSCLYENFNLNAVNPHASPKLLMCRKISEAQRCDLSTLVPCSRHTDYIAEMLLEKLLTPLRTEYCTFTDNEIYTLNVTYPVFANDYKNLALCFDSSSDSIDDCVSNKGVKNSVISSFFSYKLCKSVESFIDCLQRVVQSRCNSQEATFKMISYSLYQSILPKCFPFSDSNNKASKVKDKYAVASGIRSKTSSGEVVVQQHIEDHQESKSSVLISFNSMIFILVPFVQFLLLLIS